jgi:cytochrome c biogenesis protein CcdA
MESFLTRLIESGGIFAFLGAFLGGLLTALNPCVLATVPLIVGFVGGQKDVTIRKSLGYSLVFVLGFSLELALLFTVMAALAPYLRTAWMNCVVAVICIVLGLHFLDLFRLPISVSQDKVPKYTGFVGALLFGFMYGLISLPCTGPALALIVSLVPVKGNLFGGGLMLFYGIGNCALLIVAGTSIGATKTLIESKGTQKAANIAKKIAAVLIIIMGLYFAFWRH